MAMRQATFHSFHAATNSQRCHSPDPPCGPSTPAVFAVIALGTLPFPVVPRRRPCSHCVIMLTLTRVGQLWQAALPSTGHLASAASASARTGVPAAALATIIRGFASAHERMHSERRVVPFSPAELYKVVADVDRYSSFVPWCTASKVTAVVDKNHVVADLSVGFRVLSETYSSVITLDEARSVKVDVPRSNLFEYLVNDWYFESGAVPNSTILSFHLRFAFRNSLYQRVTDLFFEEVATQMVTAFEQRCHTLYGARRPVPPHKQQIAESSHHHPALEPPHSQPGVMHRW